MTITINKSKLTQFAEHIYIEQKDFFIHDLALHLQKSIESGTAQFENGKFMALEKSKELIDKKFFS